MAFINVKVIELRHNGKSFVNDLVERATILADKQIYGLAKETEKVIREQIRSGTKRSNSTGNLANSFFVVKTANGWGVGDIEYLNKHAPYWRHINYGSFAIGANWRHIVRPGMFFPGIAPPDNQYAGEGNQGPDRWLTSAGIGSRFSFVPTKEIKAHNYIEKTLVQILSQIPHILANIK